MVISFGDVCVEFPRGVHTFPLLLMCGISVVFSVVPCVRLCLQYVLWIVWTGAVIVPYAVFMFCKSCWELFCLVCLWFRASLIYINNCPRRCNTNQSIYYSASSLYMFRVSTTPIIRSTQNCNYSLQYWSSFLCSYLFQRGQASLATFEYYCCSMVVLLLLFIKMYADGGRPLAACSDLDRCSALCLPLFMERSLQYVDCE